MRIGFILLFLVMISAGCNPHDGKNAAAFRREPESLDMFVRAEEVARRFDFSWERGNGRMLFVNKVNRVAFAVGMAAIEVNGQVVPMDDCVRFVNEGVYLPCQATGLISSRLAPERRPEAFREAPDPDLPQDIVPLAPARPWRYIVVHHSHTTVGNAAIFGKYHREVRGWENGLGYNFVIGNGTGSGDGEVETGPRWRRQLVGAHAGNKEYNETGIGICLVGDFEESRPTARQMVALKTLARWLMERYHIPASRVRRHSDVREGDTKCPGRFFPFHDFVNALE
ncbi:MAG: peptidoglycan recognition family protein [Planctomycetota bacterium]